MELPDAARFIEAHASWKTRRDWSARRCGCGLLPDPRCEVPPVTAPGFPGDPSRNFGLFKSGAKGHYVN